MRDDAARDHARRSSCRPMPRASFRWRSRRTATSSSGSIPQRRGILPLDGLHVSRRLARSFLSGDFEIRVDGDFAGVVAACAERPETWINAEIRRLYRDLHRLGHAHSVEIWHDGRAGRRPLRRRARRRLLRREHVQPPPRRLEVRADRAGRAAARRRLPPARHPVRHRPPRAASAPSRSAAPPITASWRRR